MQKESCLLTKFAVAVIGENYYYYYYYFFFFFFFFFFVFSDVLQKDSKIEKFSFTVDSGYVMAFATLSD